MADPRRQDVKDILKLRNKPVNTTAYSLHRATKNMLTTPSGMCPIALYMVMTVAGREVWQECLPTITHNYGAATVQTVSRDTKPRYWEIVNESCE